jgi:hypothetical protein
MRIFRKEHDGEDADEDVAIHMTQSILAHSLEPQESVFYSADSDSEHDSDTGDLMTASIYRPKATKKPTTAAVATPAANGLSMLSRSNSADESPAAPFTGGWKLFLQQGCLYELAAVVSSQVQTSLLMDALADGSSSDNDSNAARRPIFRPKITRSFAEFHC